VLQLQANSEVISVGTAMAYLSEEDSVIPFNSHSSAEQHGPSDQDA
jgi:hypothetical protein